MSDRRREGPRGTLAVLHPAPRVRVTAHAGDDYQPAMVRIWYRGSDDSLMWVPAAELSPDEALSVTVACRSAAWTIATSQEEAA